MFDRRHFLRSLLGMTAAFTLGRSATFGQPPADPSAADPPGAAPPAPTEDRLGRLLPQRRLGRTEQWVTSLCFGGSHMIHEGQSEAQSAALVEAALEEGIRFFDTAQQYGSGESERRMGRSLTPKYRDVIYLMTKTQARERGRALRDMDECRRRLNVDVIDLMQIHHIESAAEVDRLVDNGVVDVLLEAREQGKIRHLGFTGHDTPRAHLRMLERLEQMGIDFDTVQMPMNVIDPGYESFIVNALPKLVERDYGVLAMKTLAFGHIMGRDAGWKRRDRVTHRVIPEQMSLEEALGFVWSLPVSSLVSGMPRVEMIRQNAAIARQQLHVDEAQRLALIDKAAAFAGPRVEFYKTRG